MASEPPVKNEDLARALKELPGLKQSSAPPKEFWPRFLTCLASLSLASRAVLLLRDSSQQPPRWRKIGEWSANAGASRFVAAFTEQLEPIAERCAQDGHFLAPLDPSASRGSGHYFVAVRLRLPGPNEECVAAFLLSEVHESGARESLLRLTLAADAPEVYLLNQAARQAKADVEKFAAALDLMVLVNTEKRFLPPRSLFATVWRRIFAATAPVWGGSKPATSGCKPSAARKSSTARWPPPKPWRWPWKNRSTRTTK